MELTPGRVAVVTGAASGLGLAMCERFAAAGLHVVLADIEEAALQRAAGRVGRPGVETLVVPTDVSDEAAVRSLAEATVERFGAVHLVCNNAGVASDADPWFGPTSAWSWVMGVNFWGVIHGIRAFLPHLAGGGHFVNTASVAGILPGFGPAYDASKHAVVAVSEDLYTSMRLAGLPVGVSVLCPGWVRTSIIDAKRNWPGRLGEVPPPAPAAEVTTPHFRRAIDEGATPAEVADRVADAVAGERFWVFSESEFLEVALDRWHSIAEGQNPPLDRDLPGVTPTKEILAQIQSLLDGS